VLLAGTEYARPAIKIVVNEDALNCSSQFNGAQAALVQIGARLRVLWSSLGQLVELSSPAASPLARPTPSQAFAHPAIDAAYCGYKNL
jgi:hypothetical protein